MEDVKHIAAFALMIALLLSGCTGAVQERDIPDELPPEELPAETTTECPTVRVMEYPDDLHTAPVQPREVSPGEKHPIAAAILGFSVEIAQEAEIENLFRIGPVECGRDPYIQTGQDRDSLHLTLDLPGTGETVTVTLQPGLLIRGGPIQDPITYSFYRTDPVQPTYRVLGEGAFQVAKDVLCDFGGFSRGEYWYVPRPPVTLEFSFAGDVNASAVEARLRDQMADLRKIEWRTPRQFTAEWNPAPGLHFVSWQGLRDTRGVLLGAHALLLDVAADVSAGGWLNGADAGLLCTASLPRDPVPSGWKNARDGTVLLRASPIPGFNIASHTLWLLCPETGDVRFLGGPWFLLAAEWLPVSGSIAVGSNREAFTLDPSGEPLRPLLTLEEGSILDIAAGDDDHLAVFVERLLDDPDGEPYPYKRVLDAWILDPTGTIVHHWPEIALHGASHPERPPNVQPAWVGDAIYLVLSEPDDEMGTHPPSLVALEVSSGAMRETGLSAASVHRVGETFYAYQEQDGSAWHLFVVVTGEDTPLTFSGDPGPNRARPVAASGDQVLFTTGSSGAAVYDHARGEVVSNLPGMRALIGRCPERWLWVFDPH